MRWIILAAFIMTWKCASVCGQCQREIMLVELCSGHTDKLGLSTSETYDSLVAYIIGITQRLRRGFIDIGFKTGPVP